MNRVAVMTFPDALKKKPFQETDWGFWGTALISLIVLSTLVTLGNRTLNFPEPALSEDVASYYVDLILGVEEKIAPLEEVTVETETVAAGAETMDEEFPEESEAMAPTPEEPVVEARRRRETVRKEPRQAAGSRVAKAEEAQAAALESSGLLAMYTVAAPTGRARASVTGGTTAPGGVSAFGVPDLGTEFGVSADLSKDRRVGGRAKGSKKEIEEQIKKGRALEAKMSKAGLEAAETLSDAQIEVTMSGPSKVEEIAEATPGRDADAIEAMMAQHRAQIVYCYQRALKSIPGLKGKVVVRFAVRANGRVTGAKVVQSTLGNAKVAHCIVEIIRRFKYEAVGKETGNLTYEVAFSFSPK